MAPGYEVPVGVGNTRFGDLRDLYERPNLLFVAAIVSNDMRRGVKYFRLDNTPLHNLNEVIEAIKEDSEVLFCFDDAEEDPKN